MRGSNHTGMRQFNERRVAGGAPSRGDGKADLARLTQFHADGVHHRQPLGGRGLAGKQDRVRGKIGQPWCRWR
ncbi:hypothetical protein ACVBEH_05915 [Roseateles sp. GG27B]